MAQRAIKSSYTQYRRAILSAKRSSGNMLAKMKKGSPSRRMHANELRERRKSFGL